MGMFTTLVHDGKDYQFKHGWDECDTVKVGDELFWSPDPFYPGEHIDGVYESIGCWPEMAAGPWVVIKYGTIIAVEPPDGPGPEWIKKKHGIGKPDRDLWPKEAWKAERRRARESAAEYKKWAKAHKDANPAAYYIHKKLHEKSFAEQILPVKKVK